MEQDHANEPKIIVIAHGSRADGANEAHVALCEQISAAVGRTVTAAFLELAEPDLPTAIDRVSADGATNIVVLPYFLHPGNHMTRDIPALAAAARERHPGVEITVAPLFGADPALVDLVVAQLGLA